jgi:hypothetical protein
MWPPHPAPSSSIAIDDALSRTRRDKDKAARKTGDKFIFGRKVRIFTLRGR